MGYIPMTLIIVLGSSLFVALVINPVFASSFIKKEVRSLPNKKKLVKTGIYMISGAILFYLFGSKLMGGVLVAFALLSLLNGFYLTPASYWFQDSLLVRLEKRYASALKWALEGKNPSLC